MADSVKLSPKERRALNRMLRRLKAQGVELSDDRFVLAVLTAATHLRDEDLLHLIRTGQRGKRRTREQRG